MATLTLGKSVTIGAVQSKKGDAVFVERRRRIVAPGNNELREEPKKVETARSAADEKLRAVLEATKARDEERRKREAEEEAARRAREAEIERENREYEAVKEQLAQREAETEQAVEEPVVVPTRENTHENKRIMSPTIITIVVMMIMTMSADKNKTALKKISKKAEKFPSMILLSVVAKMMMTMKLVCVVQIVVAVKRL